MTTGSPDTGAKGERTARRLRAVVVLLPLFAGGCGGGTMGAFPRDGETDVEAGPRDGDAAAHDPAQERGDAADPTDGADGAGEPGDVRDAPDAPSDAPGEELPPDPGRLVPRIHPDDPHRFTRDGKTWYPAGYYPGAALTMTTPDFAGDYTRYNEAFIDRIDENGINYFRVWINWGALSSGDTWDAHVLPPYERTGPGTAADGGPKLDLDRWSADYFAVVADAVDYAAARDIVVQVLLLDCWHAGFGRGHGFDALDFFAAGNNTSGVGFSTEEEWFDTAGEVFARNVAFVEEVVARIGDRPNIVWETCNEKRLGDHATPAASAADPFHAGLAEAIRAAERAHGFPAHLVMPVDLPEHRTVAGHLTPGSETIDAMRARLVGEQRAWNVILVTDNDCCRGEPDAAQLRRKAWAALTAGAHVDAFNNELCWAAVLDNANTRDGMRWIGYTRKLVDEMGIDLAGMAPADSLAGGAWTLARPGEEYIVYIEPGDGQVTIDPLPASRQAWWFDPRGGAFQAAGTGPAFAAPGSGDWVLYVRPSP